MIRERIHPNNETTGLVGAVIANVAALHKEVSRLHGDVGRLHGRVKSTHDGVDRLHRKIEGTNVRIRIFRSQSRLQRRKQSRPDGANL